ncbi:MAG: hypothetical protein RSF40_01955 [Oscillospiraceae bacterium]
MIYCAGCNNNITDTLILIQEENQTAYPFCMECSKKEIESLLNNGFDFKVAFEEINLEVENIYDEYDVDLDIDEFKERIYETNQR